MSRPSAWLCACVLLTCGVVPLLAQQTATTATNTSSTVVPTLVSFSGVLTDLNNKPLTGVVGVTFALYKEQQGGAPLWLETQNVYPDKTGHYSVMLGSTKRTGLPPDLFVAGEARWLAVQPQGQPEQPRIMLLSVPYALKAADAQTVGGLPASAFVLAAPPAAGITASPQAAVQPAATGTTSVTTAGGTVNQVPLWDSTSDITSSAITQTGGGTTAKIGIGTTTPSSTLDVKGGSTVRGTLYLPTKGTATATTTYNSQPLKLTASAFNSGTAAAVPQNFQWQAEPVGNNTATTSGTLNLLYAPGAATPAETGLKISSKGLLLAGGLGLNTAAPAQTLEVDSGNALVKGSNNFKTTADTAFLYIGDTNHPIEAIWNTGLAIGTYKVPQAFFIQDQTGKVGIGTTTPAYTLDVNGTGNFTGLVTFAPGQTFPGTGTITGVTAGTDLTGGGSSGNVTLNVDTTKVVTGVVAGTDLTGGGTGGVQTLNLDTTKVPQLVANNTFTGIQTIKGSAFGVVATGANYGLSGTGLAGVNGSGSLVGVQGTTTNGGGDGVYGEASGANAYGVYGKASGANSYAVYGFDDNISTGTGVFGMAHDCCVAVYGVGGTGVYGSGSQRAGQFSGDVGVTGNLYVGGLKAFRIDHPLDPANKYLTHAAVESSEVLNIYTGNVTTDARGEAKVQLPDWFEALNRDFRYQLTVIGQFAQAIIASEITNHSFMIRTDKPSVKVSWQVTGVRQDAYVTAHPLVVEEEKEDRFKGYFINPDLHGASEEKQIEWARNPEMMRMIKETRAKHTAAETNPDKLTP
jgi:hypothetical protein